MKRLLTFALVLMLGGIGTAYAQKKGSKQKKAEPVKLATRADSVSYAAASVFQRGLTEFLKQQYNLDEADLPTIVQGYNDFVNAADSRQQRAYMAGQSIADMVLQRFLPNMQTEFADLNIEVNRDLFVRGFSDLLSKTDGPLSQTDAEQYINTMMQEKEAAKNRQNIQIGKDFLAENAKKEGVVTTPSGLQYRILREGNGPIPKAEDEVTVKYEGKLIDGTVFDSSYSRTPNTNVFQANRLIKGWTEALCMMPVGSKWELFIPQELAYGDRAAGKIPPYSTLIFTLELDDVKSSSPAADTTTETTGTATATKKGNLPPGVRVNPATGAPNPGPAIHPKPKQK